VAVDFVASDSAPAWFAGAVEQMVMRELSGFGNLVVADPIDTRRCTGRNARCLVDLYRDAGVDLVVLGTVRPRELQYEVYATWVRGRAYDGSLRLVGVDSAVLRRHASEIVRPLVQRGGLLEERPSPATAATAKATAPPPSPVSPPVQPSADADTHPVTAILIGLIFFMAFPPFLLWLLLSPHELRKRGRPASWKWSAAIIVALALLLLAHATIDLRAAIAAHAARPDIAADLVLSILAGMLWGGFVLVNASWVFAPLEGLGHARHDAIRPLLQAWLALALFRASLLLFYAPFLWLAFKWSAALGLSARATAALVIPATGLLAYFWLLTLVDNLALFLDSHLVIGPSTTRNPWHATIKRYFRGYIRRNGVPLDPHLFDHTLFLPSLLSTIVRYGGGFARPRILVGERAREAALGGLPDETELPERTVNPDELPYGFLVPTAVATSAAGDDAPHEKSAEQQRRQRTLAPAAPRGAMPRLIGENATLLGWVVPQPVDDGIPLISDTRDDYWVVKRLLTEHYAAFERNLDDDEIDDTDPTQKDFLFGALLREMGTLKSGDLFVATIRLAVAIAEPRGIGPFKWLIRGALSFYDRFLAWPAARVADGYAALNQGMHHLIQYLSFVRGTDELGLTARASAPRLIRTSKELLEQLDRAAIPTIDRQALRATPRNRLLWISQLFYAPLARRRDRGLAAVLALALALAAGTGIIVAVRRAIDYHPVYVERLEAEAARPSEGDTSP
jgi:hypothetical protein